MTQQNRLKPRPAKAPESAVDRIYRTLFDAILAQELLPGTKLSEEAIGSFFGVSRTIVRTALNSLQNDRLIEFQRNRGAFVASPSVEEARQVFEARVCIERDIALRLASSLTGAQSAELEAHIELERAAAARGDNAASIRLSGEFHLLAARMAGNEVLASFLAELVSRTSLILALHGRRHEAECSLDEHAAILSALRSRDPDQAAAAFTRHLEDVIDRTALGQRKINSRALTDVLARYAS